MILEAFAQHLQQVDPQGLRPIGVLYAWLYYELQQAPNTPIGAVLHHELMLQATHPTQPVGPILPATDTGQRLLQQLLYFARSYEQWQLGRWIHQQQQSPSDA